LTDLIIREITPEDYPFVKATWLRHFKEHGYYTKFIRNSVYFENHAKIVDSIISKGTTLIASHVDEPEIILGFLVYQPGVIHYAYVISKARRLGVGKELLAASGLFEFTYTHRTEDAASYHANHPGLTYNPYLL
jgi:ribosomal protein S18 acetylase RimI-like enzyme